MTKAKISEYDAVAANNTDVNGVNIAENCPPSGMNNMGREIMAALKRFQTGSDGDGVTVGGSLVVAGDITVNSQGDVRFADSDSSNYVAFQAPATVATNVTFTLPAADGTSGQAIQTDGSGTLSFATIAASPGGSTTQVQFNNAGAFGGISGVTTDGTRMTASTTIGVGGATPSTSGSGITFPATQSASSDANTLDDYEEGTWTPAAEGAVTLGTYTPNNVVATYTKIGGIVVLNADFGFSAASGGVAYLVITGLPFPMKSAGVGNVKLGSVNVDDTTVNISCQRVSAGQDTKMYFASTRDNAAEQAIDSAGFTTSSLVQFQLIYSAV